MLSDNAVEACNIRPGCSAEATLLTDLAIRSKGYWGYDSIFLRDCRDELTITPEFIESNVVLVMERDGVVMGFYSLERRTDIEVELVHLFIEPDSIGHGFGRQLFKHAAEWARHAGFKDLVIKSDPFAEPFYKAIGAKLIGLESSTIRPGRTLPLLRFDLCAFNSQAFTDIGKGAKVEVKTDIA